MQITRRRPAKFVIARGVVAGVAGTAVMTAFQKFIEMPITKRGESYAPANFAEKITAIEPQTPEGRRRLNYATHFSLGLYHPTQWSKKELVIDLVDKYVQAQATGAVFDRLLDPARQA